MRMHPFMIAARLGQLDHPHRRRRATLSTRSAPQRGLSPRPADGSSRRLARVLQRLHSTSSQPRPPLRHCPIMGDGWAGPFIPFFFRRRFGEILEKLRWKNTAPVWSGRTVTLSIGLISVALMRMRRDGSQHRGRPLYRAFRASIKNPLVAWPGAGKWSRR